MQSVKALTEGLIDYAGLFPPAGLGMPDAVRNYSEYLAGSDAAMLGSFIVPVGRLAEFAGAADPYLPRVKNGEPWILAALMGQTLGTEFLGLPKFNYEHRGESGAGHAVVGSIEVKAHTTEQIQRVHSVIQGEYRVFIEIAAEKVSPALLDAIAGLGLSAKIRTGGVEQGSFPSSRSVVDFMSGCRERGIVFKATAGLHHVVWGTYPLTYEARSRKAEMFGFLNVFLAAAFLYAGASSSDVEEILCEKDPGAFNFEDSGIQWRSMTLSTDQIRSARREFSASFGSCSFTEPVQELKALINQGVGTRA